MSAPAKSPKARSSKAKPAALAADLQPPSEAERLAMAAAVERQAARPARARLALTPPDGPEGALQIHNPHTDAKGWGAHLCEAFGTSSHAYADQATGRLVNVLSAGGKIPSACEVNAALAIMGAIAPADELEATLGEQIVGAHVLGMDLMGRARRADTMDKLTAYVNLATKSARTQAALVETLTKLRSGGKQTHEVRYVYVNGDAVFSNTANAMLNSGGGGLPHFPGQSHGPGDFARLEAAPSLPMRGQDPARDALSVARDEGPEALSDSRRNEPWSAEGPSERPISDGASHSGDGRAAAPGARAGEGEP